MAYDRVEGLVCSKRIGWLVGILLWGLGLANAQPLNSTVIRVNLLGYRPGSPKMAVWGSLSPVFKTPTRFEVVDTQTHRVVLTLPAGKALGAYGPFKQTYRLNFSTLKKPGRYYLRTSAGGQSPVFRVDETVYDGAADFCLRYMRQQRSGFNPYLRDSCHTHDGYTMYGPMPDSTHLNTSGGWHDASDYLQYVTTSANATYHLLAAVRDFPSVFTDRYRSDGLPGQNSQNDALDEARWGLDWLLKMHPTDTWLFNQLADDRDHKGLRMPKEDDFYGKGFERPIYFATGQPQGLFRYKNRATGVASTAGKVSSALALGYRLLRLSDPAYAQHLRIRSQSAYTLGLQKPGNSQTAPGGAPYFYEEDNYADDMELAAVEQWHLQGKPTSGTLLADALAFARQEPVTPWLKNDTARHYQWYPFVNVGHAELAKALPTAQRKTLMNYYRQGIGHVWARAQKNAFWRGIPGIWCSNNLTTSFATQCYWYRQLSGDAQFAGLEQACFDWLFGCNPWGTSFVYGLPADADTPTDPHSAFTHLKNYPIDGGLVDGPVRNSIYSRLIGIKLIDADEYAAFQSSEDVYHDDFGDYSTNEPTMDGTASLIYLLAARQAEGRNLNKTTAAKPKPQQRLSRLTDTYSHGARMRTDSTKRQLALVFTGDEFANGADTILTVLRRHAIRASFFLTGRFLRNPNFAPYVRQLIADGHYVGPHSDAHLLYCDWKNRDSLLVTRQQFRQDLGANYAELSRFGITPDQAYTFLPPYEWHNDSIAVWTKADGANLIINTPGTLSHADYTTPTDRAYRTSEAILTSILTYEKSHPNGLNGFQLLMHIGAAPARTDTLYRHLDALIRELKKRGYRFTSVQ